MGTDGRIEHQRHRLASGAGRAGLALMATLVVLVGCSEQSGNDDSTTAQAGDSGYATDGAPSTTIAGASELGEDAMSDTSGGGGDVAPLAAEQIAVTDRRQTYTATMALEVEGLDGAVRDASAAVDALGGFSSSEDVDLGDARHATITFRVPAVQFRPALDAIAEVGDLQSQQVRNEDVTATYADIESRVTTLRTSIDRLRGFLAEATDVNQIASLEGELTRREAELESVESQRRALADQVALSTITVSFDAATTETPVDDDRTLPTFLGGLESGWDAIVSGGAVVLAVFGFLLPFLVPAALLVLAIRWLTRRRSDGVDLPEAPSGA